MKLVMVNARKSDLEKREPQLMLLNAIKSRQLAASTF
jgi:hypothetical protein